MPAARQGIPRPFEQSYGVSLGVAIAALVPFIFVTTAFTFYRKQAGAEIGVSDTALEVIAGISTAGYAFGAMLGGDLIQRFRQRLLFPLSEGLFVIGCLLTAIASGAVAYGSGRVLMGFATGLLLVIALPPVIRRFPPEKMPITAAAVNIGFFGAVTAGPLLGGAVASEHVWRWFYAALGAAALLNLTLALFTFPHQPPPNPGLKFDRSGVLLALAATVLPFWATGELTAVGFDSYRFTVLLSMGLVCLLAMLLIEYYKQEPLSPVKPMWNTFPAVGLIAAMIGGGAYIAFLSLGIQLQIQVLHRNLFEAGIAWWPQVLGLLIAAAALGLLVDSRFLPVLVLAGMLLLIGAGALLVVLDSRNSQIILPAAAALLGCDAGATVSPGLWMASFSLPSQMVGRTFALVELVRSEADYLLAPIVLQVAAVSSGGHPLTASGIHEALWITLLIAIASTAFGVLIFLLGTACLVRPDLRAWLRQNQPAFQSPAFGATIRRDPT